MSQPTLSEWLEVGEEVMLELATTALAFDDVERLAHRNEIERTLPGAYVPLLTPSASLQVGIASTLEGCTALSRALLCMEPDEELAAPDMADALGEIVNILAGALKGKIAERAGGITLGLPIFFNGAIEPTDKLEFAVSDLRLGPVRASLVMVQHKQGIGA